MAVTIEWLALSTGLTQVAVPGTVDTSFHPGATINGPIYSCRLQNDQKVVVGGLFMVAKGSSGQCIARINEDGGLDKTFNVGSGANDAVHALALDSGNKIIVCGKFTAINGIPRGRVARLNPDGGLDLSFDVDSATDGPVLACTLQPDGKIIIAGDFSTVGGTTHNRIARLTADGSLDASFDAGSGADHPIHSVLLQPDGKILIGGDFTAFGGFERIRIARLNSDGSADSSFSTSPGPDFTLRAMVLQGDGRLMIGGDFRTIGGFDRKGIARLNADGSLDVDFNAESFMTVRALTLAAGNKVLVGGSFTSFKGFSRQNLARLNADGSVDSSFDAAPGADYRVYCFAAHEDGRVIAGGDFGFMGSTARGQIARLQPDGKVDETFNPGAEVDSYLGSPERYVNMVASQADGKVLIGGTFVWVNGLPRRLLARLNRDGSVDAAFNPDISPTPGGEVMVVTVLSNGKIAIAGLFTKVNGVVRDQLARLNSDGSLDATFNPSSAGIFLKAIAEQPDGKLLVGGRGLVRLNTDGTQDTSFERLLLTSEYVRTLAIQPDGKILVGGGFPDVKGFPQSGIARLNSDGSLDRTFDCGAGAGGTDPPVVHSVVRQPDGKILVGGYFTRFDNLERYHLVRLNPDGQLDAGFDPIGWTARPIHAMAVQDDGRVIIGESYYLQGDQGRVTRLNADGTLDTSFDSRSGASGYVFSLSIQSDNRILVAGSFIGINGVACSSVARLFGSASAPFALVVPERLSEAAFGFRLTGLYEGRYEIQTSSDLIYWTPSLTVNVATSEITYTDTNGFLGTRFYRALRLP